MPTPGGLNDSLLDEYSQSRRTELGWNSPLSRHIISLLPRNILESPEEEDQPANSSSYISQMNERYQSARRQHNSFICFRQSTTRTPLLSMADEDDDQTENLSQATPEREETAGLPSPVCFDTPNENYTRKPGMRFDMETCLGYTSYHIHDPKIAMKLLLSPVRSACLRCIEEFTSPFNSKQNERNLQKLRDMLLILCVSIEDFRDTYGIMPIECCQASNPVSKLIDSRYLPPIEDEDLLGFLLIGLLKDHDQMSIEEQTSVDQILSVYQFAMSKNNTENSEPNSNEEAGGTSKTSKDYLKLTPSIPGGCQRTYNFIQEMYQDQMRVQGPILAIPSSSSDEERGNGPRHKKQQQSQQSNTANSNHNNKQRRSTGQQPANSNGKSRKPEDNVRFKTELCSHFERTAKCPKGPDCHFAHGLDELRKVNCHDKFRTRVCKNQKNCPFGEKCAFIHK